MHRNSSTSSSEEFWRFCRKLALLVVLVILMDQGLGRVGDALFARTRDSDTGGQINGLLSSRAPVVVFGSSRAESHYVPEILRQYLGEGIFNAGFKGSNALYDLGVLGLLLEEYRPRLVIYDFSAVAVARSEDDPYARLEPLYPFHSREPIATLIASRPLTAFMLRWSRTYPYNSKWHSLILFNLMRARPGVTAGYVPQYSAMPDEPISKLNWGDSRYDDRLVAGLSEFLTRAKASGAAVVIVSSPRRSSGSYPLPTAVRQLAARLEIPLFDFGLEAYPQFRDHRLYRDASHLNDAGARQFSALLARQLAHAGYARGTGSGTDAQPLGPAAR